MLVKEQTLGLAGTNGAGFGCGAMRGVSTATERWLGAESTPEIQEIQRQNELAFRLFVAASVLICALVLAAMFLG
jgi:hypothetical protein